MAYRPAGPPDKGNFPETAAFPSGLSTPKNTGYTGYSGYKPAAVDQIVIDDNMVVVLIDSTLLGAIWFALRSDWRPDDGDKTPVFYASELPFLRTKSPEQLRSIFNVKRVFDGGTVKQ